MADYLIRFICNLLPSKRPHGWPASFHHDVVCRVGNSMGLREVTNQQYAVFFRNQGMFVYLDPTNIDERKFVPDSQIFIPMHMFSRISTSTRKLASQVPDGDGVVS